MDKVQAIFKSTLRLIHQFGFHGTPMSQIAKHADVAIGTIYHYFESKDELIFALFKYCKTEVAEYIFKDDSIEKEFKERFFALWLNFVRFYIDNPEYLSFLDQFYSSPYLQQALTNETICGQDHVSAFLHEGVNAGAVKNLDTNILSVVFIGTAVSTVKRHLHSLHQFDKKSLNHIIEVIWDGIKK